MKKKNHSVSGSLSQTQVGGVRLVEKRGANQGSFCIKYKTDKNLWLHELRKEDYGADKVWVLLNIPGKEKS
jgi:hypothetical protein